MLDVSIAEEACPLGLAPTASTTAALAMGDALAVALLEHRGFRPQDFVALHPAGTLGRKLLRVEELMHVGEEIPRVGLESRMRDALLEMTAKRLGVTAVVDDQSRLVGVVTDGDLRRALGGGDDVMARPSPTSWPGVRRRSRRMRLPRSRSRPWNDMRSRSSSSSMPTTD